MNLNKIKNNKLKNLKKEKKLKLIIILKSMFKLKINQRNQKN